MCTKKFNMSLAKNIPLPLFKEGLWLGHQRRQYMCNTYPAFAQLASQITADDFLVNIVWSTRAFRVRCNVFAYSLLTCNTDSKLRKVGEMRTLVVIYLYAVP